MDYYEWQKEEDELARKYDEAYDAWLCCSNKDEQSKRDELAECRSAWFNH